VANQRVLVVESQPLVLGLIRALLTNAGMQVAAASSSAEAQKLFTSFAPDVLVTDVELGPADSGLDLAHALSTQKPNLHVVFLTDLPDFRPLGDCKKKLPRKFAFLNRSLLADPKRLLQAIEAAGSPAQIKAFRDDKQKSSDLSSVSRIQLEVLRLVAMGLTNQEIADARNVTMRAVEALITRTASVLNIHQEPGSNSRVKLARAFIREAGLPQL
jgi:DNA-binding NarL/FixJ family response regulator